MRIESRCVWAIFLAVGVAAGGDPADARPNILWITAEDISPDLGCYGDARARTPHIDRLADEGVRFTNAFSISGVCAPSRSALITGMYPTTIGTHHMRCKGIPPAYVRCFTEYLRAAGYYCTNNSKTDYNFDAPITAWDESGNQAHWRHRPEGMPFFSVINLMTTHESRIRNEKRWFAAQTERLRPEQRQDPALAELPPYYPDTPVVRRDWARYYELITAMDYLVQDILDQLEEDGLAEDTIVFFYSDHGRGLPRAKRWVYDDGIRVPLIVRWPGRIEPGTVREDLVSFIDFAPTVLSLAGADVPGQLQGRVFLGDGAGPEPAYIFAARDRMDEAYDIIRAARDRRFKYIRNFEPGKPYAQHIAYMELMPTMQEMRRLHKAGELVGPQRLYFLPEKPEEELYDLHADPHEVHNLADDWRHRRVLTRMRRALDDWRRETGDLGLIPEHELWEIRRPGGVWARTATPEISAVMDRGLKWQVTITCATPGASIAWTTSDDEQPRWNLYTGSLRLTKEEAARLRARAIRLGYLESDEARPAVAAPTGGT